MSIYIYIYIHTYICVHIASDGVYRFVWKYMGWIVLGMFSCDTQEAPAQAKLVWVRHGTWSWQSWRISYLSPPLFMYLMCSCSATLKSKAALLSRKPMPRKACPPVSLFSTRSTKYLLLSSTLSTYLRRVTTYMRHLYLDSKPSACTTTSV